MPTEITMPQLSDTMTEGTLVKWKKNEGQPVKAGEEIAEVETDKATMPMEAFEDGTLAALLIPEGQKVQVGQILAVLAGKGEDPAAIKNQYARGTAAPARPTPEKPAAKAPDQPTTPPTQTPPTPAPQPQTDRIIASPLARRLAEHMGLNLANIQGSGPGGRIVQKDVEDALTHAQPTAQPAAQPAAKPAAPLTPTLPPRILAGQTEALPLTKLRATIAQRLQTSKQQSPHFYETIDINCDQVLHLRTHLNSLLEKEGIRLSLADFIAKALASALVQHPTLNATFDGQQLTVHGDVNLGIAVSLPGGLIVPVLRGVNQMGLKEIRQRSADLIDRARQQKLKAEELSGGTFTLSNLGHFGIRQFTAIINPPEVAILAIGVAEERPVCEGDTILPRTIMSLTLSADHRVIDGAVAAAFLQTLRQHLEQPGTMLL